MDVAVTGSSGLIGSALRPALEQAGHRVIRIVRGQSGGPDTLTWDPARGEIDAGGLEGVGAVVHLAGEGIAEKRWNDAQKARIMDSRKQGTTLLAETMAKLSNPPAVLISGSAIGYYGDRGDEVLTEDSPPGTGFLADVATAWEAATAPAEAAGIRVTHIRTGIVLDKDGGALPQMVKPFKLGAGGKLGSGRQWMSWIALADEVGAIVHLLGDGALAGSGDTPAPSGGPVNLTAPNPARNVEFTQALGKALHRPSAVPAPAAAMRLLLGREMADQLLLASQRVLPTRLERSGYTFQSPDLATALELVLA